jgi:hypothetical protein
VHIPLAEAIKDAYQNLIKPVIDENDLDAFVPL